MEVFITLILFLTRLAAPERLEVLAPKPHGLFQDYGFEQSDSEKFAPILNIVKTGGYKVEEVDSSNGRRDTSLFNIFQKEDSIVIEEQRIYGGKISDSKLKKVYSKKGKMLYQATTSKNVIPNLRYFTAEGSWVWYQHLRRLDSMFLKEKIIYDKSGRPIEKDNYDEYEQFHDYATIAGKKIYKYSEKGEEIDITNSQRIPGQRPVVYRVTQDEHRKIDSVKRSIKTETTYYEYPDDAKNIVYRVSIYDQGWRIMNEHIRQTYPNGVVSSQEIIYERKFDGHLVSMTTKSDEDYIEEWEYDKSGHCISHNHGNNVDTWLYDSKGNLVESNQSGYRTKFKIFYR